MRVCLALAVCAFLPALAQAPPSIALEGRLTQRAGEAPALATADRGLVALEADEPTRKILEDKRLNGVEMKARGRLTAPGRFTVDPIHTKAVLVRRDGRLKLVTYWCDICSIRTYSPGPCWCCQKETTLDLRDPDAQ